MENDDPIDRVRPIDFAPEDKKLMRREDVADFGDIEVVRPKDAMYVAIAKHVHKKDMVVIWTGLLGWVPLSDAVPAQLLDIVQADTLRAASTSKFEVKVVRVLPPTNAGPKGVLVS